jgi:hypothetical protein
MSDTIAVVVTSALLYGLVTMQRGQSPLLPSRQTQLFFSMWPIKYAFEKSSIVCLQKKNILGWPALSIVHTNPGFSKSVVFRPIKFSATESVLARCGYQVTAEEPSASATENIQYSRTMSIIAYIAAIAGVITAIVAGFVATKLAG